MQLLQLSARFEPEVGDQQVPGLGEDRERLALSAGPVERQHQQGPQPLPVRMPGGQQPELRHHLVVAAQQQGQLEPLLRRREPQLAQPAPVQRRVRPRHAVQSAAAPAGQRLVQGGGAAGQVAGHALLAGPLPGRLEELEVQPARLDGQPVARAT